MYITYNIIKGNKYYHYEEKERIDGKLVRTYFKYIGKMDENQLKDALKNHVLIEKELTNKKILSKQIDSIVSINLPDLKVKKMDESKPGNLEIKEEIGKIIKLSTDFNGNLNIENLRLLSRNKLMQFKRDGKSEEFIKEFKLLAKKAEGKIVNVTEYTRFSENRGEPINIAQYSRTLPGDKNKKPEELTIKDYWKLKDEYVNFIKKQNLTEMQKVELINSLPQDIVYKSGNYPIVRKPVTLIKLTLEYRPTLERKIREMKESNN